MRKAKERAVSSGLEFNLTKSWAEKRYTGKCELTGIPFISKEAKSFHARSASIDRIDPSKGYTQENCRFILMAVNAFKGRMTDKEMKFIATKLVAP